MDDLIINELISLPYMERYQIYHSSYMGLFGLLNKYEDLQLYGICFLIKQLIDTSSYLKLSDKLYFDYRREMY